MTRAATYRHPSWASCPNCGRRDTFTPSREGGSDCACGLHSTVNWCDPRWSGAGNGNGTPTSETTPSPQPTPPTPEPSKDFANPLLAAALEYAARGWAVLPLHSIRNGECTCNHRKPCKAGKHPRVAHGLSSASADPKVVASWWERWPDANIAIVAGALAILDVDVKTNGPAKLAALVAQYGPLPTTRTARSGGGGWHYYFQAPPGVAKWECAGGGLELRTGSHYVLGPPSTHLSGSPYTWESEATLAPLPPWLYTAPTSGNSAGPKAEPKIDEPIPEGTRNAYLWKQACRMRHYGFTEAAILAALTAENARCVPPWDGDLADLARRAAQYEPSAQPGAGTSQDSTGPVKDGVGEDQSIGAEAFLELPPSLEWDIERVRITGDHGWTGGAPKSMKGLVSL
jgi:hypothetical protein